MKNKFHKIQKRFRFKKVIYLLMSFLIFSTNSLVLHAQKSPEQVKKSIKMTNVTVQHLVDKLGTEFKYSFFIVDEQAGITLVSVNVKNATVTEILDLAFQGKNLSYNVNDKNITISNKKVPEKENVKIKHVSGTITDTKGEAIIGASIFLKDTHKGTITDVNGKFSMDIPENSVITVSYLGFLPTDLQVKNNVNPIITLKEDSKALNEIVVIGYGSMQKKDLTGSVTSIKSAELTQNKTISFTDAMQGKLAGVQISAQSGELGSASRISIRGANSLYGSSLPLYVIDGVQIDVNTGEVASAKMGNGTTLDPMSSINPADIESIDVLKDASATAIYGARGANGVVIVTTKSGKAGRTKVSYDGFASASAVSKRIPVLNASEFVDYRYEVDPKSPLFYVDINASVPNNPYSNPYHNWQDEMLRTAISNSHNISVDGGNTDSQFSAGLGYLDNQGIIINNNYQRYSSRLKLDTRRKKLKLGISLMTSYSEFNGASQSGGEGGTFNGIVQQVVTARPVEIYIPSWDNTAQYVSPISMLKSAYKSTNLIRVNMNAYADYSINRDLSINVSIGSMLSSSKGKEFYSKTTEWGAGANGRGILSQTSAYFITNSNQLTYKKDFGKNSLNAMVAYEVNHYNYESFGVDNSNFLDESTGVNSLSKGNILQSLYSFRDMNNRMSFIGRAFYDIDKKYLLTASLRADGSDKFGKGNQFAYFPSLALAWRMSEEAFMKNQKVFENLKFRLSYGQTGNDRIPSHQYMATMENAYYGGQLGLAPATMNNNFLKWESTTQYNAGVDFGILNGHIQITADVYRKTTDNMLMPVVMPAQSGFMTQWQNKGKVQNDGIELQVSTQNIKTKDFKWTTDFNISSNKNTVLDLGGVDFIPVGIGGGWITNVGRVIVGHDIGTAYGYVFDGVYQTSDFNWQNDNDPTIPFNNRTFMLKPDVVSVKGINVKPGSFKFKNIDVSADNVVDEKDQTIISHSSPKLFGGINNTFKYKGFDLSIFLSGSYGNQIFNESRFRLEGGVPITWLNVSKDFYHNKWTPQNPSNKYGTYSIYNQTSLLASSYYVEDASFFRLTNLTLGFNVNPEDLKRIGIKEIGNLRVYVTGNNLYTWTKYTGFDPEVDSNNALLTGFDRVSYPHTKSVLFGLNLSF